MGDSTTMAFSKILVSVLVGCVAGQNSRTLPSFFGDSLTNDATPSTTPVPILKFIDQHNNDGSYTYGYQSADGTYKIETRLANGEVSGKYGYYDEHGSFKETSYGAGTGEGFKPVVDGVEYSLPAVQQTLQQAVETNLVEPDVPVLRPVSPAKQAVESPVIANRARFANFQARDSTEQNIKIVNGRRAVLKKRLRKNPRTSPKQTTLVQEQQTETAAERQLSRQEQLRAHAAQRAAVIKLQQQHARGLQLPVRAESTRSFNLQPQAQSQPLNLFNENPFVTGLDRAAGTYTISY